MAFSIDDVLYVCDRQETCAQLPMPKPKMKKEKPWIIKKNLNE